MQHQVDEEWLPLRQSDVRAVAKNALLQILEPLAEFVSDSGFSVGELHAMFREVAVKGAAKRQIEASNRINISGIAATTGISRSEISRILKDAPASVESEEKSSDTYQQSTNRILAAWHEDPKFTGPNGQPADLRIYGRGATFESLAKRYGRGISARAVLDELVRVGATELLPTQRIRAKAAITVDRGMNARVIKSFGDRVSELIETMILNMRKPEAPKFIGTVSDSHVLKSLLPLFRKDLALKGAGFLADVQESLSRKPQKHSIRRRDESYAGVSVTIYCHESSDSRYQKIKPASKRRNFRRQR